MSQLQVGNNLTFCTPSVQQSHTLEFHRQLDAQCFYIYDTQLLHILANYPCHLVAP
jgi:hypothetical protein